MFKTFYVDNPTQFRPSIIRDELDQYHFQGNVVQGISRLFVIHKLF